MWYQFVVLIGKTVSALKLREVSESTLLGDVAINHQATRLIADVFHGFSHAVTPHIHYHLHPCTRTCMLYVHVVRA